MALEVDDVDATVAWLRSRGVLFEEVQRAAWFFDNEGNLIGIGQPVHR